MVLLDINFQLELQKQETDRLRKDYHSNGFILLKKVLDINSVAAARAALQAAVSEARRQAGSNAQRLSPLQKYPHIVHPELIPSLYKLCPDLQRAVEILFEDCITPCPDMANDLHLTSLLIEPKTIKWSTGLHRDYRDFSDLDNQESLRRWRRACRDNSMFNQINISLYEDDCLWVIPGSHQRNDNLLEKVLVSSRFILDYRYGITKKFPVFTNHLGWFKFALKAIGAQQVLMSPGDALIYRNHILHTGLYYPGRTRMTIHDGVYSRNWHDFAVSI